MHIKHNVTREHTLLHYLHTFQGPGPGVLAAELVVPHPDGHVAAREHLGLGSAHDDKAHGLAPLHDDLTVVQLNWGVR